MHMERNPQKLSFDQIFKNLPKNLIGFLKIIDKYCKKLDEKIMMLNIVSYYYMSQDFVGKNDVNYCELFKRRDNLIYIKRAI